MYQECLTLFFRFFHYKVTCFPFFSHCTSTLGKKDIVHGLHLTECVVTHWRQYIYMHYLAFFCMNDLSFLALFIGMSIIGAKSGFDYFCLEDT